MIASSYSIDSEEDCQEIPSGILKPSVRGGGWQGDELELEHQRERIRSAKDQDGDTHAAVNLSQFRNTVVGEGYQAKHVVRQATKKEDQIPVIDMSKPSSARAEGRNKRHHDDRETRRKEDKKGSSTDDRVRRYLCCRGLREFRMELDKIE
jgi:hypothetical protein